MYQEERQIYYDRDLNIEAYNLSGIVQKFPNHFHEDYVIGFVEGGRRHLCCKGRAYQVRAGDLLLFNPHDNHFCEPIDGEPLDYRAVNISTAIMAKAVREIAGREQVLHFTQPVVAQSDIAPAVSSLYNTIMYNSSKLEKEEKFFFLLDQLLQEHASYLNAANELRLSEQITNLCTYIQDNFANNITLDELVAMTSFGKSHLLRSFTKQVGVSPYRYLQNIRLNKAKKLLEQGVTPLDTAIMAGFSDQSHFTNFFKEFIGLTPKQYQRIFAEHTSSLLNNPKER